jgi:glycosyl transferase family 25
MPDLNLQVFVISMQHSHERRSRAKAELAKTRLKWQFLDAIDGKKLVFPIPEYPIKKVKQMLGFELMPGEIGAFLSHKKAWQACVANHQTTLIFEDDFILMSSFEQTLEYLLTQFHDWSLLRLQALKDSPCEVIHHANDFAIARNKIDPLGCTAYLVKAGAAQQLIACAPQIFEPIDHYIEHQQLHGLEFLAVRPYPCDISQTPTTVDRPERKSIRGWKKWRRSIYRWLDRTFSKSPWFPR